MTNKKNSTPNTVFDKLNAMNAELDKKLAETGHKVSVEDILNDDSANNEIEFHIQNIIMDAFINNLACSILGAKQFLSGGNCYGFCFVDEKLAYTADKHLMELMEMYIMTSTGRTDIDENILAIYMQDELDKIEKAIRKLGSTIISEMVKNTFEDPAGYTAKNIDNDDIPF